MKRILTTMCALTLLLAASVPALAAEPEQSASYYPTSVEEYMEGDSPRIKKVYQLSLADDPSQIPTEDFERDGRLYYLLDMTRKDEVGVDIQTITQTKTLASETNNMEKILQSLEPQMEVTTEDGYTGTLTLDHTTVKVAADGYATRTKDLSATRTYPNLSEADLSLIPKSIEDNGKSLTLADVQWAETSEAGADGAVTRYTATAKYTGTILAFPVHPSLIEEKAAGRIEGVHILGQMVRQQAGKEPQAAALSHFVPLRQAVFLRSLPGFLLGGIRLVQLLLVGGQRLGIRRFQAEMLPQLILHKGPSIQWLDIMLCLRGQHL